MSRAMQRLKLPFSAQVGWKVGDPVGFLVGKGCVGWGVGFVEGDLVGL